MTNFIQQKASVFMHSISGNSGVYSIDEATQIIPINR
jgi:hypothetical protein